MKKQDVKSEIVVFRATKKHMNRIKYICNLYGFTMSEWLRQSSVNYNPGGKRGRTRKKSK